MRSALTKSGGFPASATDGPDGPNVICAILSLSCNVHNNHFEEPLSIFVKIQIKLRLKIS